MAIHPSLITQFPRSKMATKKTPCWTESSSARWDNYSFYGLIKNTICVLWYHEYSYCLTLMSDFMPSLCKLLKLRLRVIWILICTNFCNIFEVLQKEIGTTNSLKKNSTNDSIIVLYVMICIIKFQCRTLVTLSFLFLTSGKLLQIFILS